MDKKKLVPEVRFSGFNDEWVPKKLDDLVIQIRSYPISRRFESQEKTSLKYIHYGDIHTGVAKKVKNDSSIPYIKPGEYELLQQGDFVVADASEDYKGIAAPCIIVDKPNNGLVAGLHTIAMRPIKVDPYFLFNLFNTEIFEKFGQVMGTGIKVFGITYTNLSRFIANLPELEEQEKIGALFEKIDKAIELQEKLVEENKNFKKSMLQKMFPKKGKDIPEIRFNGFYYDWNELKLDDILIEGSKIRVEDTSLFRRITVKLHKNGVEEFILERKMADSRPFYQRFSNEIIIGKQNYFNGSIAIVPEEFNGFIASNAIMSFSVDIDKVDLLFVYYNISRDEYIARRSHVANGTGQKEISEREFLRLKIKLPSLPEQKAIGLFFKSLDKKIELEEKKLENYKTLKKALLQKMFI